MCLYDYKVLMWSDDEENIIKARRGEKINPKKGLAIAIWKKAIDDDEYTDRPINWKEKG